MTTPPKIAEHLATIHRLIADLSADNREQFFETIDVELLAIESLAEPQPPWLEAWRKLRVSIGLLERQVGEQSAESARNDAFAAAEELRSKLDGVPLNDASRLVLGPDAGDLGA